jgi:hypothetical protein
MNFINLHKTHLLIGILCFFGASAIWASAPSLISGNKFTFDVKYDVEVPFITIHYFLPDSVRLEEDWEQGSYSWTRSGSSGTILMEDYGHEKLEIIVNFSNYTFQAIESSGSLSEIVGSGTFTVESYAESELPYDKYFSDDFTDPDFSESIWGNYSYDGFSAKIHEGGYTMYGTMSEDGNRWGQEIGARSLLGLDKDWYVQGTAFSENGERIELSIECDMDPLFQLEVHLSTYGNGVNSSLQYERYDQGDDYEEQHLNNYDYSSNGSDSKHATFRIRNSASEKSFHIEWLDGKDWKNLNSFNWHTGTLSKEASSGWNNSSNFQFHDWESMESYYFNPQMEFGVPDSLTVNLGDYGFTSFSVIEGEPMNSTPSIEGKKLRLQIVEHANDFIGAHEFYALSSTELWANHFVQSNEPSDESVWEKGAYIFEIGDDGVSTLKIGGTLEGIAQGSYVDVTLSFTEETSGSFYAQGYEIEDGNQVKDNPTNAIGTFLISDFDASILPIEAPALLTNKKLTFGGLPILVMANEQGSAKVQDLDSGDWEDQSYQWDASGTTATLYLDGTPEDKDKVLKLTFTSNTAGTVEWENWDTDTNGQNFLKESGTDTFTITDFTAEELPVTKDWMWFDHYPWVYSHVEGGWLYFHASGSKLMVYSHKDQVWREMQ